MAGYTIRRLTAGAAGADIEALAGLLIDAVESGAAVSFVLPLTRERAEAWWRRTLESASPRAVFLVAADERGLVGTVQVQPAWAPNQPHRGEICKLIVHRRARGAGLGRALMERAEAEALAAGMTLLVLDAKRGGAAERLYRRLGWTFCGIIPRFAVDPDGKALHDTVIFYKELAHG